MPTASPRLIARNSFISANPGCTAPWPDAVRNGVISASIAGLRVGADTIVSGTPRAIVRRAAAATNDLKRFSGDGVFSLDFKAGRRYIDRAYRPSHPAAHDGPDTAASIRPTGLGFDPRTHQVPALRV